MTKKLFMLLIILFSFSHAEDRGFFRRDYGRGMVYFIRGTDTLGQVEIAIFDSVLVKSNMQIGDTTVYSLFNTPAKLLSVKNTQNFFAAIQGIDDIAEMTNATQIQGGVFNAVGRQTSTSTAITTRSIWGNLCIGEDYFNNTDQTSAVIIGCEGRVNHWGTKILGTMIGFEATMFARAGAGTVNNAYSFYANGVNGTSTVTGSSIGFYSNPVNTGGIGGTYYHFYGNGDYKSYFGGTGLFGGSTSTTARIGIQNGLFANATEWYNSSGVEIGKLDSSGIASFASVVLTGTVQGTTAKLTNLTDGYIPYHVSDASGLANSSIQSNGTNTGIGGAVLTNVGANILGTITSANNAFGVYMGQMTLTPATGNSAYFQYVGGGAVATGASNTVANAYALYCEAMSKTGGGTITNTYGLYVNPSTSGTNNYGASIGGITQVTGGSFTVSNDYSYFYGLRLSGNDGGNTIYNGSNPIAITTNGATITLSSAISGNDFRITTTGINLIGGSTTTTAKVGIKNGLLADAVQGTNSRDQLIWNIDSLGNWKGGLLYGEMYVTMGGIAVVIPSADTMIQVSSGINEGLTNGITFQNAREFKVLIAGKYKVDWSMSPVTTAVANKEAEGAVMINGVTTGKATAHSEVSPGGSNRPETLSGHGIFSLAVNDLVSLAVSNHTDGTDFVVEHVSCTILWVGK